MMPFTGNSNVSSFIVGLNSFSGGTGIEVLSGTSDHYNIVNNLCGSATTCVSDGGSGTHKTISGNN
jgi:hypothetical protein